MKKLSTNIVQCDGACWMIWCGNRSEATEDSTAQEILEITMVSLKTIRNMTCAMNKQKKIEVMNNLCFSEWNCLQLKPQSWNELNCSIYMNIFIKPLCCCLLVCWRSDCSILNVSKKQTQQPFLVLTWCLCPSRAATATYLQGGQGWPWEAAV